MNLEYYDSDKNNDYYEIRNIVKILKDLDPTNSLYQYLNNELLIQVYTSYEKFLKELLIQLFRDAKENYKYEPFLKDHKLWGVIESSKYIVPRGMKEDLCKNFPLINNTYFYDSLDIIDTIVNERNSFAHSGTHKASFEQIMSGYLISRYITKYLIFCYVSSDEIMIKKLKGIQDFISNFVPHANNIIDKIKTQYFPDNMNAFDSHVQIYHQLLSDGYFNIDSRIQELFSEENFNFLIDYKKVEVNIFKDSLQDLSDKICKIFLDFPIMNKLNKQQILRFMNLDTD